MTLASAIKKYGEVRFEEHPTGFACLINGVGGTGRSPEVAFASALSEWRVIEIDAKKSYSSRRTSKKARRTSRRRR